MEPYGPAQRPTFVRDSGIVLRRMSEPSDKNGVESESSEEDSPTESQPSVEATDPIADAKAEAKAFSGHLGLGQHLRRKGK